MDSAWNEEYLDAVLVPAGILVLVAYHVNLAYRVWKFPTTTVIGINQLSLQAWLRSVMKDGLKNGGLIVQTMRNSILSSTLLAAASLTLSSMIGVLLNNYHHTSNGRACRLMLGDRTLVAPPAIKLLCLLACFLLASLCYVRSVTYYSNAGVVFTVPLGDTLPAFTPENLKWSLVWASHLRLMGTRAFLFSFPLFLWLYGPVQMFCCSVLATTLLYFVDKANWKPNCHIAPEVDLNDPEAFPLMLDSLPADSVCHFCPHH